MSRTTWIRRLTRAKFLPSRKRQQWLRDLIADLPAVTVTRACRRLGLPEYSFLWRIADIERLMQMVAPVRVGDAAA